MTVTTVGDEAGPAPEQWRALHRLHEGAVTKEAGVYLDHDRPIPENLVAMFDELAWAGWLSIAEGDPLWEQRRVGLTESGQARYAVLREQHTAPDPLFGTIQTSPDAPAPGGEPGTR